MPSDEAPRKLFDEFMVIFAVRQILGMNCVWPRAWISEASNALALTCGFSFKETI